MIHRIKRDKEHPYVMILKAMLENPSLSFKAKGLMAYMLSKPDDWQIYTSQFATQAKEDRHTIENIMQELIEHGYVERRAMDNHQGYEYTIFEAGKPTQDNGGMVEKLPSSSENSQSMVEKLPRSMVEKLPLLNTERLSKKKIDTSVSIDSETEPTKTSKKPTSPNTESQRIIEKCFLDAYQEDFNDKPKMNYALNRKLINECLKTHSAEHVCRIIEVARHDKFIKDRGLFDLPQILSASIYNRLSKNVTHNKRDVPKCPVCNRRLIGVLCPKCNERKDE